MNIGTTLGEVIRMATRMWHGIHLKFWMGLKQPDTGQFRTSYLYFHPNVQLQLSTSTAINQIQTAKTTICHQRMNISTFSIRKSILTVVCLPIWVQFLKYNNWSHITTSYFHWELNTKFCIFFITWYINLTKKHWYNRNCDCPYISMQTIM